MKRILVIPAGGSGRRMGTGIPKQFLSLAGKTVLGVTIERMASFSLFDKIVLAVPNEHRDRAESIARSVSLPVIVVDGGKNRRESVFRGLQIVEDFNPSIVVVHDAVRPLITRRVVEEVIDAADKNGAATLAVGSVDTIGVVKKGILVSQPDRKTIYHIQTPQAFRFSILMNAHKTVTKRVTDDAGLVLAAGQEVTIVEGYSENVKITTPGDLMLAELLLNKGYIH